MSQKVALKLAQKQAPKLAPKVARKVARVYWVETTLLSDVTQAEDVCGSGHRRGGKGGHEEGRGEAEAAPPSFAARPPTNRQIGLFGRVARTLAPILLFEFEFVDFFQNVKKRTGSILRRSIDRVEGDTVPRTLEFPESCFLRKQTARAEWQL